MAALLTTFPVLYAISSSLMTQRDFNAGAVLPSWPLEFGNYAAAFGKFPLLHYLLNTLIMSGIVTVALLITSSLAAFAFTFIPFRGRSVLFGIVLATLMIPWEATIIVNFQTVRDLGWLNTFAGLTVPSFAMAFGIFLLRQSFRTLPVELYEAIQIDGASRFRFFVSVVLPLSRPMLATLGVYSFITTWNKYLWPLLVTSTDKVRTVQIALKGMQGEATTAWPLVMAATVMVMAATVLVLVIGQRQLKAGLAAGAVKG
ncbi:carbohydrate ABC transporter permease [Microbacterium sp. KUDC0406]|uniref:carbohydrate ABC transporter permease n=1 Tax=Microbacterium sp. KUDC0406 TaxID=2909588 RepID=UPI001F275AEA|nr:carbohydrate ABC transporter permease [Microbacterium sp. KUDC0406]UJP09593.1 carbohydrate ABC transporter permease [Microbacterium sp. KUDC0406]